MITEAVISFIMFPVLLLMDGLDFILPVVTVPTKFFMGAGILLDYISWILPIAELLPLFFIRIALECFNLVWKLVLRIKSFIPTMGG